MDFQGIPGGCRSGTPTARWSLQTTDTAFLRNPDHRRNTWEIRFARGFDAPAHLTHIMHQEPPSANSSQIQSHLEDATKPLAESAAAAYDTIRHEACQLASCASATIRKNPLPAVVGAAVIGAAACYLILSACHQATLRERYVDEPLADAGENINAALRSLYNNLKFW